ncbi:ATP-binding protein [Streptomyces sp. WAC00263]|uniref:ATP-binding protein n=1 Tax=Streptomyces sp. WAC00263 TaxID=1917422 RepID=UPI0015EE41CE|nr:ATP-binding protein [Streptomyces sp. WAC00263]KAF5994160.1 ATP-binding protein [Streptomyces sp. WAC00263]
MTKPSLLGATPCVVWRWTSCTPNGPAQARAALRCALDQLGYDGAVISDVVLAVSEFIANAAEHGVGPYEMRLRRTAAEVICEVEDHDPHIPEIPAFPAVAPYAPVEGDRGGGLETLCALLSERGRGLHIVHELTKGAWGFRSKKETKTAWLALPANVPPPRTATVMRPDDGGREEPREYGDRSYDVDR